MGHFGHRNMDKLYIVEKTNINSMPNDLGGLFAVHKYKSKFKQGKVFANCEQPGLILFRLSKLRKTVLSKTHKVKKKIIVALSIMSLFK